MEQEVSGTRVAFSKTGNSGMMNGEAIIYYINWSSDPMELEELARVFLR